MSPEATRLTEALARVDAASTKCGDAVTAIAARIQKLLGKIATATSLEDAQTLAAKADEEAGQLEAVAAALAPLGTDVSDPVPVPPPDI